MRRTHPVIAFDLDGTPSRIGGHRRDVPDGKPAFVEEWCRAHGAALHEVAVVGDSRSDVPLFRAAGKSIALDATADARAAAGHVIDTEDLRDILPPPPLGRTHASFPRPGSPRRPGSRLRHRLPL
ncbi:HAD hydrolase family protein [Streptomyces sp. NPDC001698]|uniref:HAD hydrolase family protein n=1 Tax=unclassified Streptomyces TaxID=2593676 RepID=UPI0036B9DE5C